MLNWVRAAHQETHGRVSDRIRRLNAGQAEFDQPELVMPRSSNLVEAHEASLSLVNPLSAEDCRTLLRDEASRRRAMLRSVQTEPIGVTKHAVVIDKLRLRQPTKALR
jgi:hypothetical protein